MKMCKMRKGQADKRKLRYSYHSEDRLEIDKKIASQEAKKNSQKLFYGRYSPNEVCALKDESIKIK